MRGLVVFLFASVLSAQVYIGPITDPYAATRTAPGSIGTQPVMPTWVAGPQQVGLNQDLYAAFVSTYSAQLTNGFINVDTVTGNDSTCAVNTSKACATINKAMRLTVDSYIYVTCPASGTYTISTSGGLEYRFTDAGYGNGVKMLIFDQPCHLVFPGDTIATNTWTAAAGHPNTYQTTLACYPATCGGVSSIQRTDQNDGCTIKGAPCTDTWGTAFPDRLYAAIPNQWSHSTLYTAGQYVWDGSYVLYQCIATCAVADEPPSARWTTLLAGSTNWDSAGLANLDLLSEGWYFTPSSSTLYVKLNGLDLTDPANAAKLRARYWEQGNYPLSGGGSNPRIMPYGTTLYVSNAYLDGLHVETLQYNNAGTWVNGSIWMQNCTMFDSWGYGVQQRGGGWSRVQNSVMHANQSDGINSDMAADTVTASHMELIYVQASWAGDPHTWVSGVLPPPFPNANGESSHSGYAVYIGTLMFQNLGPECADGLTNATVPNQSWYVGADCEDISPYNTGNPGGFQQSAVSIGGPNSRQTWIDTGYSTNEHLNGTQYNIYITNGAVCKLYNNTYTAPIFYANANVCTNYTPNAP
jgi:hypothetical protein